MSFDQRSISNWGDHFKTYQYIIQNWVKDKEKAINDESFQSFLIILQKNMDICICSDDRITEPIIKLIKDWNFLQYNQYYTSENKQKLSAIIDLLFHKKFIPKQGFIKIKEILKNFYLQSMLQDFLELTTYSNGNHKYTECSQIVSCWKSTVGKNFMQTWQFLMAHQIYNKLILKVIRVAIPEIKKYSQQNISKIENYYKACFEALNHPSSFSKPIDQKLQKYQQKRLKIYQEQLNLFISQKCLYFQQAKLGLVKKQINQIMKQLGNNNPKLQNLTYKMYGSLKSNFALVNDFDADISINTNLTISNRFQENLLFRQIQQTLKIISFIDPNIIQYINGPNIKKPVVRILFYKCRDTSKYLNTILKNMDITIDGHQAQRNSYVLSLYSSSQYIVKFCCLNKLWAKQSGIVNFEKPQFGMSSYGIVLMSLFYLIEKDQAPYIISEQNEYVLERPLRKQQSYPSLLENFKGFLQFYSQNGEFFRGNKIVCLKNLYQINGYINVNLNKYLINMYDFVDNTNPGRYSRSYKNQFFQKVQSTLSAIAKLQPFRTIFIEK